MEHFPIKTHIPKMRTVRYQVASHSKGTEAPQVAERFCLRSGRQEMSGSIPGNACRPSRSEFPVVFSETRSNTG